ncbi:MAG: FlgD immunoglobulin-like domain containing protein, partial [Gammaproteobacteria bacterium]
AMVGKQVVTRSDQLSTQEPPSAVSGQIDLPAATAGLTLSVQSASGQTLRSLPLGSQAAGIHEFTWDGLDLNGNPLPAGDYRLVAVVAESSDQSPEVRLRDQDTSVTVDETAELH